MIGVLRSFWRRTEFIPAIVAHYATMAGMNLATVKLSAWRYGVTAARSDAESSMTCCSWPLVLTWKAP
jgi:hypothetical protein